MTVVDRAVVASYTEGVEVTCDTDVSYSRYVVGSWLSGLARLWFIVHGYGALPVPLVLFDIGEGSMFEGWVSA